MSSAPNPPELSDYLAVLKRRRRLLACVCVPVLVITLAVALGLPDMFVATGLIQFTGAPISGDLPEAPAVRQKAFIDAYMVGLADAVLSPAVLGQLIQQMPRLVAPGQATADAMLEIIDRTRVRPVKLAVLDPSSGRQRDVIAGFAISFDARDALTAQAVASWLTQAFVGGNRIGLQTRAEAAREFYRMASAKYAARISQLESQLADFRAHHLEELPGRESVNWSELVRVQRELDQVTQQMRTLAESRIFLEARLTRARMAVLDRGMLGQLQAQYDKLTARLDADHPSMLSLRAQIDRMRSTGQSLDTLSTDAQLQMQRAWLGLLRQRYSDEHPDVKRLRRQIAGLEERAATDPNSASGDNRHQPAGLADTAVEQATTQLSELDTRADELQQLQGRLNAKLTAIEQRLISSPMIAHEYQTLSADLQSARARYESLSRSEMSVESTAAAIASGRSDDLTIVQAPRVPDRADKPRRLLVLGSGLALAVLAGLGVVIARENLDQKVRSRRDIHELLDEWPLVAIPRMYDTEQARRQSWHIAVLSAATLVGATVAVIAGRIFFV